MLPNPSMLRRAMQSSLLRAASIYGLANMLRQAVPLLLVPVLTRYLTPEDYGMQAVFGVLTAVLVPLVGINVAAAVSRKYFDREQIDLPTYVASALGVVVCASVAIGGVLAAASGLVSELSEVPREWLWAALVVAIAQPIVGVVLSLLQVVQRPRSYGAVQVGRAVAITGMTTLLVVGLGYDWRGSVLGQVFAAVLFATIALFLLVKEGWLRLRFDAGYARHAIGYGLPLVPHTLSAILMQVFDRLLITHHAGLAQTGLYTLGYQLGALIGLLEDSFNRAFQPWLFEQLKRDDPAVKLRLVRFTYAYCAALAVLALGLGLAAPLILSILVPNKFQGASIHVIWIALGYAFNGMYKMVSGYIFYSERTGMLAWMTFLSAAVNVALNLLLVPRHGALGAAYASSAGFFVSLCLTWILSARTFPMPWLAGLRF